MFCDKCGSVIKDGDMFCSTCGAKQTDKNTEEKVAQSMAMPVSSINDIEEQNEVIKKIWPDWELIEKIGEGSFGKVYRAKREEVGNITSYSAIKIIRIPQSSSEIDSVKSEVGLDEQSTTAYFKGFVDDCVNEIKMMESLKGTQNIVSVEDYKVVPHKKEIGWTIYIRMELLTSFVAHTKDKILSEKEVIKLGIDMCNALEFCAKCNVMHRDIKPENIFISSFGIYKLGDFGIARKLEKSTTGMSKKGTYNYMAPEIYNGKTSYDFKSDIYSLGIVLYKLLNGNRFPLVDPRSSNITYQQMQDAFDKRMQGAVLPKPLNASDALSNVILTACAFNPDDRFASASALKMALTNVQNGTADKVVNPPRNNPVKNDGTIGVINRKPPQNKPPVKVNPVPNQGGVKKFDTTPVMPKREKPEKVKKERKKMSKGKKVKITLVSVAVVIVVLVITLTVTFFTSAAYDVSKSIKAESYSEALFDYDFEVEGNFIQKLFLKSILKGYDDKIIELFKNGEIEYNSAVDALGTLDKMGFDGAAEKINEITSIKDADSALEKGDKYYENGDYENAIKEYSRIDKSNENYDAVQTKLNELYPKYISSIVEKANTYNSAKNYEEAVVYVNTAYELLPDGVDTTQLDKIKNESLASYKSDIMNQVTELINASQFEEALDLIDEAIKVDDNKDFQNTKTTTQNKYVEHITNDVNSKLGKKNYDGALNAVTKALTVLENNSDLIKLKENVVKATPTYLVNVLEPYESNDYTVFKNGETVKMGGVERKNGFKLDVYGWNGESRAVYNLESNYDTVSGIIGYVDGSIGDGETWEINILADGKIVYKQTVSPGELPHEFSVDVTGVSQLEFKTLNTSGFSGNIGFAEIEID